MSSRRSKKRNRKRKSSNQMNHERTVQNDVTPSQSETSFEKSNSLKNLNQTMNVESVKEGNPPEQQGDRSELVKHLRLINFTLLVASVGLFISITHTPARVIDRACKDLDRVIDISLKWNSGQLEEVIEQAASKQLNNSIDSLYVQMPDKKVAKLTPSSPWLISSGLRHSFKNLNQEHELSDRNKKHLLSEDGTEIRTLEDFQKVWDLLSKTHYLYQPVNIVKDSCVLTRKEKNDIVESKVHPFYDQYSMRVWKKTENSTSTWGTGKTTSQTPSISFLSDNKTVISGIRNRNGELKLISTDLLKQKSHTLNQFASLESIKSSLLPERDLIAIIENGQITYYQFSTGKKSEELNQICEEINSNYKRSFTFTNRVRNAVVNVVHSPDGEIATIQTPDLVYVVDLNKMEIKDRIQLVKYGSSDYGEHSVLDISKQGDFLALSYDRIEHGLDFPNFNPFVKRKEKKKDYQFAIYDTAKEEIINTIKLSHKITDASFSTPESELVAISLSDGTVIVCNLHTSILNMPAAEGVHFFTPHSAEVTSIVFSPNGQTLVSAGLDKPGSGNEKTGNVNSSVRFWDTNTWENIDETHGFETSSLKYSPDGQFVVGGNSRHSNLQMKNVWFTEKYKTHSNSSQIDQIRISARSSDNLELKNGEFAISVDLKVKSVPVNFRDRLVGLSTSPFRTRSLFFSSYKESFPELSTQARGVFDSPLKNALSVLETQKELTGEQFELAGIKIPVVVLTTYGIWFLAIAEFYFFLHLRRLRKEISDDDKAWDCPWLGIYEGMIPVFSVIFSTVFLPLYSAYHLLKMEESDGYNLVIRGGYAVLIVSGVAAVWEFYQLRQRSASIKSPK
ncbi:WD40 repeat domain-containing protein [Gimesia panareensis]|uniref:WD40 repeat domain-containing protein n=1 Tax=Gimesia panareensis TaxID=2527978 RepID=UPI00118ADC47|nr:hypothetical protein [Gimesia panareensis]QDU49843.1 Eukaryotic translation initiation factor eIF2A [Gimesia panareensis]